MAVDRVFKGNRVYRQQGRRRESCTQSEFDSSIEVIQQARGKRNANRHSWNAQTKFSAVPTAKLNSLFDAMYVRPFGVIVDPRCVSSIFPRHVPELSHFVFIAILLPWRKNCGDNGNKTSCILEEKLTFSKLSRLKFCNLYLHIYMTFYLFYLLVTVH